MHYELSCGSKGYIKQRKGNLNSRLKSHREGKGHNECEIAKRWTFPISEMCVEVKKNE
jgi:hypothetical protein